MEKYQRIEEVTVLSVIRTERDENGMITRVGLVEYLTPEGHALRMGDEKFFERYEKA